MFRDSFENLSMAGFTVKTASIESTPLKLLVVEPIVVSVTGDFECQSLVKFLVLSPVLVGGPDDNLGVSFFLLDSVETKEHKNSQW